MLIGWNSVWLGLSHFVCFPFTEPGRNKQLEDCEEQFAEFDKMVIGLQLGTPPLRALVWQRKWLAETAAHTHSCTSGEAGGKGVFRGTKWAEPGQS